MYLYNFEGKSFNKSVHGRLLSSLVSFLTIITQFTLEGVLCTHVCIIKIHPPSFDALASLVTCSGNSVSVIVSTTVQKHRSKGYLKWSLCSTKLAFSGRKKARYITF